MNPSKFRFRIWLGWLSLLMALPAGVSCSTNDSDVNASVAGSSHSASGMSAIGGTSGVSASSLGGAGTQSVGGAFAQSGSTSSAGAASTSAGGSAGAGAGAAGTSAGGSAGGVTSSAGTSAGTSSAGTSSAGAGTAGAAGSSAAFTQVSNILGKNCGLAGCHADKQTPHFVPGAMLYATLTGPNTVLAECDYTKLVEAGDPTKSALVRLMNRKCGTFTMPPSCNKTPCLSAADLQTLSDWIASGAPP